MKLKLRVRTIYIVNFIKFLS